MSWLDEKFLNGQGVDLSTENPQPLGTASPGSSGLAADAHHVHPIPSIATTAVSGYMSASDKSKLDAYPAKESLLDIQFDALPNQTLSAGGAFTIGGYASTVTVGGASSIAIVNGTGLNVVKATAAETYISFASAAFASGWSIFDPDASYELIVTMASIPNMVENGAEVGAGFVAPATLNPNFSVSQRYTAGARVRSTFQSSPPNYGGGTYQTTPIRTTDEILIAKLRPEVKIGYSALASAPAVRSLIGIIPTPAQATPHIPDGGGLVVKMSVHFCTGLTTTFKRLQLFAKRGTT